MYCLPADTADIYVDETYARDDGTDAWCTTDTLLAYDLFSPPTYQPPTCEVWACGLTGFRASFTAANMVILALPMCKDREAFMGNVHLICM